MLQDREKRGIARLSCQSHRQTAREGVTKKNIVSSNNLERRSLKRRKLGQKAITESIGAFQGYLLERGKGTKKDLRGKKKNLKRRDDILASRRRKET